MICRWWPLSKLKSVLRYCIFKCRKRIPVVLLNRICFLLSHILNIKQKNQKRGRGILEMLLERTRLPRISPFTGSGLWRYHLFWSVVSVFVCAREYEAIVECCPCSKLPQCREFRRPELKGFAWNYSTDRYGIVSDNRGYSTNASKKIFDNLALVIFAEYITKEISEWEWVNPVHCLPLSWGPRLYWRLYLETEWKEKMNFTKHV